MVALVSSCGVTYAIPPGPQPSVDLFVTHSVVRPGERQTVRILTDALAKVVLNVTFPSGLPLNITRRAGGNGELDYSFVQPANSISRRSQTVTVSATALPFIFPGPHMTYRIAFAPVDIAAARQAFSGDLVLIDVHAGPRVPIQVMLKRSGAPGRMVRGNTGTRGWFHVSYRVPETAPQGKLVVTAIAGKRTTVAATPVALSLLGRFVPHMGISGYTVLRWAGGQWEGGSPFYLGDRVRFIAQYLAYDRGFVRYPTGTTGSVRVEAEGHVIFSSPLHPDTIEAIPNGLDVETTFTNPADAGTLKVTLTVAYGGSSDSYTFTVDLLPPPTPQ